MGNAVFSPQRQIKYECSLTPFTPDASSFQVSILVNECVAGCGCGASPIRQCSSDPELSGENTQDFYFCHISGCQMRKLSIEQVTGREGGHSNKIKYPVLLKPPQFWWLIIFHHYTGNNHFQKRSQASWQKHKNPRNNDRPAAQFFFNFSGWEQ